MKSLLQRLRVPARWRVDGFRYSRKLNGLKLLARFKLGYPHEVSCAGATANFYHDGLQGYYSAENSRREEPVLGHLLDNLREGDVFFDVGGNLGFYTCLVGRHVPGVSCVAIEPYPPNLELLRRNIERNDVDATVVDVALAAERGEATFTAMHTGAAGAQEAGIVNEHIAGLSDRPASVITVETVPGDDLVEDGVVPAPTVLRIDAERTGESVLRGLESSLSQDTCRLVYVEPHGNQDAIERTLRAFGFRIERIPLTGRVADAYVLGTRE